MMLTIDSSTLSSYTAHYFALHPRAKNSPITHPYHPSINVWSILPRLQMNALKQKWLQFGIWLINDLGLSNKKIEKCKMRFVTYYPTKRRADCDNSTPKYLLDSFVESGLIIDDDYLHLTSLTLECGYSKEHPRTEIYIDILE